MLHQDRRHHSLIFVIENVAVLHVQPVESGWGRVEQPKPGEPSLHDRKGWPESTGRCQHTSFAAHHQVRHRGLSDRATLRQIEVLEDHDLFGRPGHLGDLIGRPTDDQRCCQSPPNLPRDRSVKMRVDPEEPFRVIGRNGEPVVERLTVRDLDENVVGLAGGGYVQSVKVEVRWLSEAVPEVDSDLVVRPGLDDRTGYRTSPLSPEQSLPRITDSG